MLILNLVVLVAVPTQTPVELSQTVTEYALADEAFAQAHTLTLTGTLTKSVLHSNLFHGTLTISGLDGMEEPYTLTLTREDGAWHGLSGEASILFSAGKEMDHTSDRAAGQSGRGCGCALSCTRRCQPQCGSDPVVYLLSGVSHKIKHIFLCVLFKPPLEFSFPSAYTATVIESQSKKLHGRQ